MTDIRDLQDNFDPTSVDHSMQWRWSLRWKGDEHARLDLVLGPGEEPDKTLEGRLDAAVGDGWEVDGRRHEPTTRLPYRAPSSRARADILDDLERRLGCLLSTASSPRSGRASKVAPAKLPSPSMTSRNHGDEPHQQVHQGDPDWGAAGTAAPPCHRTALPPRVARAGRTRSRHPPQPRAWPRSAPSPAPPRRGRAGNLARPDARHAHDPSRLAKYHDHAGTARRCAAPDAARHDRYARGPDWSWRCTKQRAHAPARAPAARNQAVTSLHPKAAGSLFRNLRPRRLAPPPHRGGGRPTCAAQPGAHDREAP